MLMNDYFRKLGMGGHFSSSPFTKADETPTYGKRWLEDLSQPLCPKNCHFGVTADDVVAYAEKMHVSPLFRFNPQSLTTEFEHSLATHQSDWSAKLAEVATLLSQHGADARPMAVHQLAESLLTVIQFSGHVQRHQAVIDADSHAGDLDIRSRHTLEGVTETMARWESIAAQWVDGAIATALGSPLSSCELGVVADVIAAEGAPKAASTLYRRAEERALTQSDRFYYHAMALTTRLDPSTYWLSDGARVEAMSLYNDIAVALKSGSNVAEMVDGGGQAQPVGNVDQLYVAEAIAGRLYFDLVSDELSREQDSERIASRQHTLEGLEATLRERLSTRAHVASLPESIHALEFAASVANRYIQPGGVISSAHETRSEAITQVLASVAQLTSLGEQFGPTDSVSTAVLSEFKAQLAWMGNVESYRRASLPWEALHRIKSVLEPRYAATETYKSLLMALYRQAPQHFDAQMHFNPRDVATNEEGVKAGLSEFSQSLNSSASPWRRFFVDSGTTLAGAGAGFLLGNLPGAAIGAVVGGGSGEVGNVGLNALEDRQYIHQAARAGITDVTPEMVKASSLFWGGSLVVSSALRAFGGYGLGSMAVKRFGTSFAVRNALQFAIDNPAATLQAARAGIPGAIFGTSEVGRSFYRNYWFRLGMMAVGVDAVGLHRQANGHIELRSDWVPDTWVGYAGIGLMLLSPQSLAVLTTEGRSYLARWWTTEMVRYPGALTRATVAAARGLLSETPALTQSWTLTQWRDGLLGVIQSMPQLANRPMAQWSLGEWWDVGTQLRSVQSGTSVEEI